MLNLILIIIIFVFILRQFICYANTFVKDIRANYAIKKICKRL